MLAAKKTNTESAKQADSVVRAKSADKVAPQASMNPLWHGLATHVVDKPGVGHSAVPEFQRLCTECGEQPDLGLGDVQTKMSLGSVDDPYEREADSVAQQVVSAATPSLNSHPHATDLSLSSVSSANVLQRSIAGASAGVPMRSDVRQRIEPVLNSGLGHVRVHSDSHSQLAAQAINARAFTHGNNIYLGPGQGAGDVQLMAHEATHVVQQGRSGSAVQRDATDQCITPAYAAALDDGELMFQLQLVEQLLGEAAQNAEGNEDLVNNLDYLREEYFGRDPGSNAIGVQTGAAESINPGFEGLIPEGGETINKVGIVAWDSDPQLRLRAEPDTNSRVITHLPFSSRLQIIKRFPGDWYFVATANGDLGYAAANYIWQDLPEPNANLHRVESGVSGTAIGIAERYYGEYADDWGQDLRFYINVLAWANGIEVPSSTTGWRSVHFQAGQLIWVPSQQFAYSLKGVVNSGSYSYNIADFIGIADFIERVGQLWADFRRAIELSEQYISDAVVHHLEEALYAMVEGLIYLLLGAVAILAISTAVGAAIGALAGGVGAAPGAAAGFEVGMVIIEWLGLGMLLLWIGQSVVQLGSAFGGFLGTVWDARGNEEVLDQAARQFADAMGLLLAKIFEALVMFVGAKGLPKGLEAVRGTRLGQAAGEARVGRWLSERAQNVHSGEAPLAGPQQVIGRVLGTGRPGAEPANVAGRGQTARFNELPPDRLPGNLPEGHFWMRNAEGEWVLMREAGAPEAAFELSVYSDGAGNTNYVLRSGDRMIQSDAITRSNGTYARGQQRLPEEISEVGANNPYRDPVTGEVWDKGHGVDYADTLEGPGVLSSTTDVANFSPQASWWNRGPRNTLVGRIRNGHAASNRPGGGGYREMAIYAENPPVTANGTPIPREFIFVETNSAGVAQRAWRIPNQHGAGSRSMSAINGMGIGLNQVPPVMLRANVPMQAAGLNVSFAPGVIFGIRGDSEGAFATDNEPQQCIDESISPSPVDAPLEPQVCE